MEMYSSTISCLVVIVKVQDHKPISYCRKHPPAFLLREINKDSGSQSESCKTSRTLRNG